MERKSDEEISRRLCSTITALLCGSDMRIPMNGAQMWFKRRQRSQSTGDVTTRHCEANIKLCPSIHHSELFLSFSLAGCGVGPPPRLLPLAHPFIGRRLSFYVQLFIMQVPKEMKASFCVLTIDTKLLIWIVFYVCFNDWLHWRFSTAGRFNRIDQNVSSSSHDGGLLWTPPTVFFFFF